MGACGPWGANGNGELGDGTTVNRSTPVQMLSGGVQAISAGFSSGMILKTMGAYGPVASMEGGQLGDGNANGQSHSREEILSGGVQAISAGGWQSLILKTDAKPLAPWAWTTAARLATGGTLAAVRSH